jgi:ATP-dependent Clp protease adaptor protein ClpS
MSTITKKQIHTELDNILSHPYILILENDDHNTFDHVIESLIKYCGHELEQATQCAHIVHFTGKCDVKRGDKEVVMKSYNKLKGVGLSVTIEEA